MRAFGMAIVSLAGWLMLAGSAEAGDCGCDQSCNTGCCQSQNCSPSYAVVRRHHWCHHHHQAPLLMPMMPATMQVAPSFAAVSAAPVVAPSFAAVSAAPIAVAPSFAPVAASAFVQPSFGVLNQESCGSYPLKPPPVRDVFPSRA